VYPSESDSTDDEAIVLRVPNATHEHHIISMSATIINIFATFPAAEVSHPLFACTTQHIRNQD
jgi:hypothetical protein